MKPKLITILFAVLPLAGSLCLVQVASADRDYSRRSYSEDEVSARDLRSFERYLDTHDETARTLYQNPDLINDRQFVRDHDALQGWLENHREAAQALRADPNQYLWRQRSTSAADFLNQLLGSSR